MRVLWFAFRVLIVLAVFGLVGWALAQHMITHSAAQGVPEYEVRLAAYTGGLFAGGSLAAIVGVVMILMDRRSAKRRRNL